MKDVLKVAVVVALGFIFYRELPGMKRYWNIKKM